MEKHGLAKRSGKVIPEYWVWVAMRARCNNPRSQVYSYYGGRGIKVCNRWNDFSKFIEDMGRRPVGMTLDRKDNNGDYEPPNCRWVTMAEQVKNKRHKANPWGATAGIRKFGNVWQARITVKYKELHLGTFKTYDEAVIARKAAELKYLG